MLTEEERSSITSLLAEVGGQKDARGEDITRLLLRLPSKPEALAFLFQALRDQDHPWRDRLLATIAHLQGLLEGATVAIPVPAASDLERILRSTEPYPAKVQALIESAKREDRTAVEVVRKLIQNESNAFVLATMASFLGRLGDPGDRERLMLLLQNEDLRVVANALEALNRLGLSLALENLSGYIEHGDVRIRINALSMLARVDQGKCLDRLPTLMGSRDPGLRSAVAHLLGQIAAHDRGRALPLILQMLDAEDKVPVLKQIAIALRKNVSQKTVEMVLGPLYAMKAKCIGGKLSMIAMIMQEIAVEYGLVESQVNTIGEKYVREQEMKRLGQTVTQVSQTISLEEVGAVVPDPTPDPAPTPAPVAPPSLPAELTRMFSEEVTASESPPPTAPAVPVRPAAASASIEAPDLQTTLKIDVKKELQPVAEEAEDEPLSFSGVWGSNQAAAPAEAPGAVKRNTQTMSVSAPRSTQSMRKPSPSRVTKMPTGKFKIEETAPAPRGIPRPLMGALASIMVIAGVIVFAMFGKDSTPVVAEATRPAAPAAAAKVTPRPAKAKATPTQRVIKGTGLKADADDNSGQGGVLGPQGSKLDIEGVVVRSDRGRVILKSKGRFYLVKGQNLPSLDVGSTYRTSGTLGGVAQNGLVFVDAET